MLLDQVGIEPATSWSPDGRASGWATKAANTSFLFMVKINNDFRYHFYFLFLVFKHLLFFLFYRKKVLRFPMNSFKIIQQSQRLCGVFLEVYVITVKQVHSFSELSGV